MHIYFLSVWTGELLISPGVFLMTIPLLFHFTEDSAPERKTREIGKRPFNRWGEVIIGKHDLKPLLPLQGASELHRE